MADFHKGFRNVDTSSDSEFFFRFLDEVNVNDSILRYRTRMVELCPPAAGAQVLDVGCGLGHEARRLARHVGAGGNVVGIDTSEAMIREASRRTSALQLSLSFRTGNAERLDFADGTFDLVRAERVLLYLEEPLRAVREMARVLRGGSHVVVFDFDYAAYFIDSNRDRISRRIEALLSADPRNPLIGRQLPGLFRQAGLAVQHIEPFTVVPSLAMVRRIYAGAIERGLRDAELTRDEVEDWWADQESLEAAGRFYHAHPGYIVVGAKPL